jgi:hypothetical protein
MRKGSRKHWRSDTKGRLGMTWEDYSQKEQLDSVIRRIVVESLERRRDFQ